MERSTRPPQGNPEVRKRREPGLGGSRDGGGDLEEIPSLLEAPPEGEERERRGRGRQSAEKQALLPSGLQLPPVLPLAGASYEPVVKAAPRETYSLQRLSLSPKHSRGKAGNRSKKTLVTGTLLHRQHL